MSCCKILFTLMIFMSFGFCQNKVSLINNGYENVVIAINGNVDEDQSLITGIKVKRFV